MTTTDGIPILRVRGVEMAFGGVRALRGVDLDIAQGERVGILGPNGAGKTTLFNVIAGDLRPTAGTVQISGRDVTAEPARLRPRLGLARTYQRSRLFTGLSVEDNLFLAVVGKEGGHYRAIRSGRDTPHRERARRVASRVGLEGQLDTLVAQLSHGEQRQLEVGMALVVDPSLMMLDEPASGLSRGEQERLTELLRSLPGDLTLLLIEHNMDVALAVAERIVVMHEGEKLTEGTPEEIRADQTVHDIYLGRRVGHG